MASAVTPSLGSQNHQDPHHVQATQETQKTQETQETPDALMRWLRTEEEEAHQWSQQPLRRECKRMEEAKSLCTRTVQDLQALQQVLAQVEATYQVLETHTGGVRSACEPWMEKEAHLSELVKALEEALAWFDGADKASAFFDQPDSIILTHSDFLPMVHRIRESIAFLNAHPQYLDSPRYKSRFYQCQRKAAILLQRHILQQWSRVEEEWKGSKDKSSFTTQHVRLRSLVKEIQPMIKALESLALDDPKEYGDFLQECVRQYAQLRQTLGIPLINSHLTLLSQSGIISFCQKVAAYLASLCLEERKIHGLLFFKDHGHVLRDDILVPFLQPLAYALEPHLSHLSPSSPTFQQCLSAIRASLADEPAASIALGNQVTSTPQEDTSPSPSSSLIHEDSDPDRQDTKSAATEAGCLIQ